MENPKVDIDFFERIPEEDRRILDYVGRAAGNLGVRAYVVGGYVRDILLQRPTKDIDVVTVGSGVALAKEVKKLMPEVQSLKVFKRFGTAQLKCKDFEVEFVGARKESYRHDSRKPAVEEGSLEDDQLRRDFTINALSVPLNSKDKGSLLDPFQGILDLHKGIIRTPRDPEATFSDDPLRMIRAVRFSSQLQFDIHRDTLEGMCRVAKRIKIVSYERIRDELQKIMATAKPSKGFILLEEVGLLPIIFPELSALKGVVVKNGIGHKDNFYHTLEVLDNVARKTDNIWLRWGALLHDIGKAPTKRFSEEEGWTFHGHEVVGAKMVKRIFNRLKLPLDERMAYVKQLVRHHLRPISLTKENITDSAIRRLLFDMGDSIDDLMLLCEADITSKNANKVKRFLSNYKLVRAKLKEVEEKDKIRNWQPPVSGDLIMKTFGINPSREVGVIKTAIREAILDGIIPNDRQAAIQYMIEVGEKLGLKPMEKNLKDQSNHD